MNSNNEISTNSELLKSTNRSLELLKIGDLDKAMDSFNLILKSNFNNTIAETGVKCCKYWLPRINKLKQYDDNFEKGQLLFKEWKKFELFISNLKNINAKVISYLMHYIFNWALDSFKNDNTKNKILDFNTIFMIALAYKKIGDFKNAIKYFETAISIDNDNSNTMAQLADCYALIDEDKKAKLLFREAFFIDPSSIDLNLLDSNMITYLVSSMLELNVSKKEICHWIPIYGRILGVFIITRELIPVEINKIRREIVYLEKNYQEDLIKDNFLKAKLLNCYLWLYDYIKFSKNDKNELQELENKIKTVSPSIYDLFKNKTK